MRDKCRLAGLTMVSSAVSRLLGPNLMRPPRPTVLLWIIICNVALSISALAEDPAMNQARFDTELVPLLRTYCFDCHGEEDGEGDISLGAYPTPDAVLKDRDVWMRALAQVRLGTMPPADGEELPADIRLQLSSLIDQFANSVNCIQDPNAGKVVLRRLNRFEYHNTIRDLLGVDFEPSLNFPGDDVGYGFDNIGDVLSLPPLLMEKYLAAAEEISRQAIATPPPGEIYEKSLSAMKMEGADKFRFGRGALSMSTTGFVNFEPDLPFGGEFSLTITAFGDQGGDEPCKMEIRVDGEETAIVDVPSEDAEDYEVRLKLRPGKRKLEIGFINDFYRPETKEDRNLFLVHVELLGQQRNNRYIPSTERPPSHDKIVFVTPDRDRSAIEATRQVLNRLMSRAFRRPVSDQEVERLARLANQVREGGGTFDESIQVCLQAVLVSPHFLFKVERLVPTETGETSQSISDFELATRMSYFLWSSMPDDRLFKVAWSGRLREPNVLRAEVARMIRDPKANALVENFAGQWLQLRKLESTLPDEKTFPEFSTEIRALMKRETLTFFAGVMRRNLPANALIDGEFTYLNERLAGYYGIQGVSGEAFRLVSLEDSPRAGLLTQGSVLTVTSNPTRTSPVKRGKWILENLLNTPPPPPPPDVPELEKGALSGTLRERLEQHRANPACAACHNMMDPLGFALENFDAVGRYRSEDGGQAIDASGKMPDGTAFEGVEQLRSHLAKQRREQFIRCLTEKLMIYALGRGLEYYDKCAVDEILEQAKAHDYRFAYLIAGIVESTPFQQQGER